MQKKYRRMLIMLVYILVVSSTIAYSALTSTLQLNAEAKLRTISDIRVTGISLSSANGGTLQYESSYDVNTITSGFVLPTADSSITYKVTVTNNGTIDQTIYDILTQSSNNSGLYYEISGYNVRDVIGFKSVVEFYITYKTTTPSEEPINVVNRFNFKKVYHVTFEAKGGTSITDGIKYEGVDLSLSTFTSTKQGYILSGWTDEQDGTTVKYQTNGTYTLDRDLILYAVWEGNPNTSYSVNHYVHDLGTNTYTLDSTDNLTGTTDSTLTLASLKKTIPGFTYVDGYLTGGTTKPTEGAVTTTTILADGSRVINLYYRRNYLYVRYHVNGGQLAEQHGSHFGIANSLVTSTGNTTPNKFWVGVYGSKVNAVTNANTYTQGTAGLDNYNNPNYLNLEKTGYTGKSGQEWNTSSDGTETSYSQATTTYDANTFGGADLSTGDQVVTLYVNWVPVNYEIMYDLQGGTLSTTNPTTYNIETDTFTLNNPTLTGYTFTGWTGSNGNTPQTTVTIPTGSTGDRAYIAHWQANSYTVTFDTNGGTIGANELFSFDGSNHTIDGTIVGATWGTDYLQFAGNTSSYVDLGQINSDYMTLQTTFSVDETISSTQIIIGNLESGGGSIHITQYQGQYVIEGQFYIDNSYRVIHSDIVPEVGKKYNVLLSYDGKIEKLYINDILIGSIEVEGVIKPPVSNTIMALGGNPYGSTMHDGSFKGKIYNASIYSNPKKQVTYNSQYGTLPEPTRSNYVFKGWNGKNILNIPDKNISFTNNWYSQESANPNYIFKPSTDYTLTFDYDINLTDTYLASVGYGNTTYSKDIRSLGYNSTNAGKMVFRFTTPATFDYDPPYAWFRFVRRSSSGDADVDISNIQLEEGTTATPYEPYYVTSSTNVTQDKNHTLKAIWDLKESTFLQGQQFNAKIKQLAGNQDATYETANTNITSIVRSNSLNIMPIDDNVVSTSDSNTPIYAWFDNNSGTLYYYTDAVNIYMNSSAPYMFYNLRNATSIDLDDINTTKTTSMYGLFHSCINLSNLDLSNFDTSDVRSARAMFAYDSSLSSLDLSSFDLGKVNDTTFIFEGMTSLKTLQTPSVYPTDSSKKITLPKLMIDASGNEYTELDNTSPTETMLYTPATFIDGWKFNLRIKQLAGNQIETYGVDDNNITSIVRSNTLSITPTNANVVSTTDSYTPIYVWFDSNDGTIYYYTEAEHPYMNANAHSMFRQLVQATSIDLSTINTSKVTHIAAMFYASSSLIDLDLSTFDMSGITTSEGISSMLGALNSLQSLKTPKVYPTDSSVKITLPKLMIDSNGNEYTELNSSSPTETMLYTPATFLPGQEFNAKIKQLAGNQDATYETADTNITSIVRSNTLSIIPTSDNIVSTNDSYTPIYAWFNNGVIYYYSEANNLYMNKTATRMFTNLKSVTGIDLSTISTVKSTIFYELFYNDINLETIDVSHFNTSNVTDMQRMFRNCSKIETLNLSNFNTAKVTDMRMMFSGCSSLETLNISSFRTPNVVYMNGMFTYTKLQTLDLSNFDMTKVTNTTDILRDMSSLESLKTPNTYPSEAVIQMPKTLYDPSGNGWSVLDSSAPTETWLHKMVCKRATTLHTETCSQTNDSRYCSGAGYKVGGSKNTRTITYGSLGTNDSTLNGGDAFTCDVNGDGTFNELTERFYYVGDYYNTTTKEFETDTGVLVYYNNVSAGVANNTATSEYDTSGENWHGPVTAITQLPTTSQWTNVSLKNNTRAILTYNNGSMTDGGTLPNDFSYSGYSARLLTVQEINHSLNRSLSSLYSRLDDVAPYLFENTKYSTPTLNHRWWLETVATNNASAYTVMTTQSNSYNNGIYSKAVAIPTGISVRPAIEVNKNFLNKKVNAYLITYDTNGGSENTTQTVTVGDSLDSLSVPTKEGYTFAGWYTEASGGTQITTATVPTATTTYYAHWTPINYNITYDLDGGEVGTANPTTYNPDSNSITLNNPTKTGYTFAGWSGGKNLFNKDATPYYQNSWINESGGRNSEQYYSVYKIPIDENKEYTITHTHTVVNPCYAIFDENDTLLSVEKYSSRKTITFTSPANSKYILVSVITDPTFTPHYDKDIFQLEEGTIATSYEPYVSNQTSLTIPSGSVGNRKYTANWTANSYTVTADANGGSIPTTNGWTGTGNTATKSVTYDSQYGTLPTPTRNGYTFKGWNGKNLFDYQNNSYYTAATIKEVINGESAYKLKTNYLSNNIWPVFRTDETEMEEDSIYTMSLDIWADSATSFYSQRFFINNATSINPHNLDTIETNKQKLYATYTYKTSSMQILHIYPSASNNPTNEIYISNVQIEEGSNVTPYEPYYVTSSTNVTQDKNHTLKAIWKMNTYKITYDLQGGSLANSNPATYNVETNTFTLNNPTLTGQTFIGWTGSNGNTPEVNVTIPVGSYGDKAYVAHFSPIYEPETRIRSLNTIGTSIADDDPDSNLRFIGSNPNNYVSFNGQKWRIIGVFDGKLKIIGDSIGKYSWDTSRNTVNKGYGINQWGPNNNGYTGADLMKLLNPGYSSNTDLKCNTTVTITDGVANCGDNTDSNYTTGLVNNSLYWNASSGKCYTNGNYNVTDCNFTSTGLKDTTSKNMIDDATWYLGSVNASQNIWAANTFTASFAYNFERGNLSGKQCTQNNTYCSDTVDRTTTWTGKVGLIYPSDYIYATGGGSTYNRNTCLTVHAGYVSDNSVSNWYNTYTDCKNNDWLLNTSMWTWSLSPRAYSSYSDGVFYVIPAGFFANYSAMGAGSVRPVVYLKSSIKLTSGDGSYNSPFNLIDTE